jgi:hypothetical protein
LGLFRLKRNISTKQLTTDFSVKKKLIWTQVFKRGFYLFIIFVGLSFFFCGTLNAFPQLPFPSFIVYFFMVSSETWVEVSPCQSWLSEAQQSLKGKLTWLVTLEDVIAFSSYESFRSYKMSQSLNVIIHPCMLLLYYDNNGRKVLVYC